MPDKYVKGMKQRPGDMAGEPCEGPGTDGNGCERTESSRWLAAGRCCTAMKCQQFFRVGKYSSGAAAAKAKADVDVQRVHKPTPISPAALAATARVNAQTAAEQPPRLLSRRRLKRGEMLLPLPADAAAQYGDDADELRNNFGIAEPAQRAGPLIVLNMRRDLPSCSNEYMCPYQRLLHYSFLVAGTFIYTTDACLAAYDSMHGRIKEHIPFPPEDERNVLGEFTRWTRLTNGCSFFSETINIADDAEAHAACVAFMEQNGVHAHDMALVRGDPATTLSGDGSGFMTYGHHFCSDERCVCRVAK